MTQQSEARTGQAARTYAQRACVLIVEDNGLNMKLFQAITEAWGYEAVCTARGASAFELAVATDPCLILLDIQLPDIPGVEVIRQLRGDPRTEAVPILVVTAFAMAGDAERFMAAGATMYLSKPVLPTRLAEAVFALAGPPGSTRSGVPRQGLRPNPKLQ